MNVVSRAPSAASRTPRVRREQGRMSVAPGFVETDRFAESNGAAIRAQSPYGRVATPDEVAAVVYLASPAARWSTGAVLDVNGASHLR